MPARPFLNRFGCAKLVPLALCVLVGCGGGALSDVTIRFRPSDESQVAATDVAETGSGTAGSTDTAGSAGEEP